MTHIDVTVEIEVERDDNSVTLTVEGTYEPITPGKTWGPPETCYPDEGDGASITRVLLEGKEDYLRDEAETQAAYEAIEEAAMKQIREDYDPPDSDDFPQEYYGP
jgi:hypothetical protein